MNYSIYPYGIGGELPEGIPVVNDTTTGGANKALSAEMGKKLAAIAHKGEIFVAAADASEEEKLAADYQCTGTHDEIVIQQAVNAIYAMGGGMLLLSRGTFMIDSFPNHDNNDDGGSDTAILIPSNNTTGYEIRIIGGVMRYSGGDNSKGTTIRVSDSCYESLNPNSKYKIFRATYNTSLAGKSKVSLFMESLAIDLPYNQKKIMCIDLLYCNRVFIHLVTCKAYISGYNGRTVSRTNPPDIAVEGCVGIRFTGGSNFGYLCEYRNLDASGFYEGFQVGGEHVVCSNLGGTFNFYTYTFGNYPWSEGFNHPITMINCSQEATVNYPLFAYCSESRNNSESGQMISIINFNLENLPSQIPGGAFGNLAREVKPGTFHGEIIYTIQYKYGGSPLSTTMKFWEDGHGHRFQSRNSTQLLACDTTTRNSYAPNYLQRIWDTTLNKEVICVDTANKTWKDTAGNTV